MCDHDMRVVFHESRVHVARKSHRCIECEALIAPGIKYHRHAGVAYVDGGPKNFWVAKLCLSCETDWDNLTDIEFKEVGMAGRVCYGDLRQRIGEASLNGWLTEGVGLEIYLRWFTPDPEEIDLGPRLLPGGVHQSEAWRLIALPFAEFARA